MTSPYRPPSCDLLNKPRLKECPFCGDQNIFKPTAPPHKVHCYRCETYGPWYDPLGHKWNSIPRRPEVEELLRLVDAVTDWEGTLINTDEFYEDGNQMIAELNQLQKHADQMRKEWNL